MSLRALDLFSGIGGITYGLRGIVTPIAYVEKNKDAREFLKKKHLVVPVFDDVCTFDAMPLKGNIDIIIAGWPCTGFSTAGKGGGFSHHASGLFTEIVRLTKECDPKYLFLENSHILSQKKNLDVVVSAFSELGYDCRWVTCQATCVGAPHQRHRWFCIVSKRHVDLDIKIPHIEPFDWENNEPLRQVKMSTLENKRISKWLGNAVVPDQVRFAFTQLVNMKTKVTKATTKKKIHCGFSINNDIFSQHMIFQSRKPLNIELRQETPPLKHNATTPLIGFCVRRFWSTPTFTGPFTGTRVLTFRSSRLLSSQVIFSKNGTHGWSLHCDWLTWLMGYEKIFFKQ
jgi:DNA-cytosine methyltransferase